MAREQTAELAKANFFWRLARLSAPLLSIVLLSAGHAQSLLLAPKADGRRTFDRKAVIERHFESSRPKPRSTIGGAVPGSRLLEQAKLRTNSIRRRTQQQPFTQPFSSGASPTLPGIELRWGTPAGEIPTAVVTGDFNNDGKIDFIVSNGLTNDLWFYAGNGDGTFQLPRVIPLSKGLAPVALAAADFRGHGTLDLVVAEFDTCTLGVLFGNGDGTFGYEQDYALPQPPSALVVDDFNHDGKQDVAAVMVTSDHPITSAAPSVPYLALLTGDGKGGFGAPTFTSNWPYASTAWNLASADVNGDGLPDLFITGPGNENAQIFLNNGDGTFRPGQTILGNGSIPIILDGKLADVNGDGCPDALIADATGWVWIAKGDCAGNFTGLHEIPTGSTNAAILLADVNGDGHMDILTSSLPEAYAGGPGFESMGNSLSVLFGNGKGNFSNARTYPGPGQAYSLAVGAFAGTAQLDVVTADNDTNTVTVYQNDGSGGFGFPQGVNTVAPYQQVAIYPFSGLSFADINGDGTPDTFMLTQAGSGEYFATAAPNDGTGHLSAPVYSDSGLSSAGSGSQTLGYRISDYRLGDFRKTGHQDVLEVGYSQPQANGAPVPFVAFMPGHGDGTWDKATVTPTSGAYGVIATGDFNRDGKLDFVVVGGAQSHTLTPLLGNGDGTFRSGAVVTFNDQNSDIARVYAGDFNNDGLLDILVYDTSNGYGTATSALWEFDGNGDGTFRQARQLFTDFQPMMLADVNGDGRFDIVQYTSISPDLAPPAQPTFTTYLGQTDGTFQQSSTYSPYAGRPSEVLPYQQLGGPLAYSMAADLNGDGKPEEIAWQWDTGAQLWGQVLMGNGDGTFTPTYDVFPFYIQDIPLYSYALTGGKSADLVEVDPLGGAVDVYRSAPAPALQIALQDEVVIGNRDCGWVFADVGSSADRSVTLSTSVSGIDLPGSVSIPANEENAEFCFTLLPSYDWHRVFDMNASLDGTTATAYGSDAYALGFSESVSPSTLPDIYAGQTSAPVTVTLTSSQGYSSTAKLSCEGLLPGTSCKFASDTAAISPGQPVPTIVTLMTDSGALSAMTPFVHESFAIVADDGNVAKQQTVDLWLRSLMAQALTDSLITLTGGTASTTLSITGIPPYNLSCSGLPAGASCSFSGTQGASSQITLTVAVPSGGNPGNYSFNVNVTSGPDSVSIPISLQVISITIEAPPASSGWGTPGFTMTLPVTFQASTNQGSLSTSCTLDTGATCTPGSAFLSTTPQVENLSLV